MWWQEVHPTQGGRAGVMRGGRGAGATKVLVADLDAIGFRNGADPWLPVSRSAAVAAGDDSHRLFSTPRRGPRRSARAGPPVPHDRRDAVNFPERGGSG